MAYDTRRLAEIAADYEVSGQGMREVAARHGVGLATVQRAVELERQAAGGFGTRSRAFDLQRHVAEVLIKMAEVQQQALATLAEQMGKPEFRERQSGRDWGALIGTMSREGRGWFEYMRRTFGERATGAVTPYDVDDDRIYEVDTHE